MSSPSPVATSSSSLETWACSPLVQYRRADCVHGDAGELAPRNEMRDEHERSGLAFYLPQRVSKGEMLSARTYITACGRL